MLKQNVTYFQIRFSEKLREIFKNGFLLLAKYTPIHNMYVIKLVFDKLEKCHFLTSHVELP